MKIVTSIILGICISLFAANFALALDWPVFRDSTYKPIGNSYGQYQCYGDGCYPYMHSGIDIMAPTGTPVYAVKAGYVKAVITTSTEAYWRVVIGDSSSAAVCEAFMYAHLDEYSIAVSPGQYIEEGQYLADVVYFPYNNFNHLHFSKIRFWGTIQNWQINWYDWEFVGNPIDDMDVVNDPDPPVFENAYGSQIFALCQNQSSVYYEADDTITGEVDIISRIYDYINEYGYKVTPHTIEYRIDDDPWIPSFTFSTEIGPYGNEMGTLTEVIYKDDGICDTKGDYDLREYYFIITNTDGDSILEPYDRNRSWRTADYNNGEHIIYVKAFDRTGNVTIESMSVNIANFFALDGSVQLSDVVPQPNDGIVVTVIPSGLTDTTDAVGDFSMADVGGGDQLIEISRPGFISADTTLMMNQDRQLEIILYPGGYLAGDANCDGSVNVGDVVYIINFVFKGGPAPIPFAAGGANGDPEVNIGDAVYLINHIFNNGPPPILL
jgi:hypothetical protein